MTNFAFPIDQAATIYATCHEALEFTRKGMSRGFPGTPEQAQAGIRFAETLEQVIHSLKAADAVSGKVGFHLSGLELSAVITAFQLATGHIRADVVMVPDNHLELVLETLVSLTTQAGLLEPEEAN